MSANSAVTVLRSPSFAPEVCRSGAMRTPPVTSAADGLPSSAPRVLLSSLTHSPQNFFSGRGFSAAHCLHDLLARRRSPHRTACPPDFPLHTSRSASCPLGFLHVQLVEQGLGALEIGGV